jgi:hypothetical protein
MHDTTVLVRDDGVVIGGLAFDSTAVLGQFGDLVTASMMDKDLSRTHLVYRTRFEKVRDGSCLFDQRCERTW